MIVRFLFLLILTCAACSKPQNVVIPIPQNIITGAQQTDKYLPLLKNKRVALFVNHTSMVDSIHLLYLLLKHNIQITLIFAPEHGFQGILDAGKNFKNDIDTQTGIPIISMMNTSLSAKFANQFDILICDIQDVGLRFYTYYVSMIKLMDLCAQTRKNMIILDRPNPNGYYVDGPILDMKYKSPVGWLPIPIVHGMTLGELASMANGEGWLSQKRHCPLTVIPCLNYTHNTRYHLPIAPSPNLPNMRAIYLYASLCYFEATPISVGRGTPHPFQIYGHPLLKNHFSFTPHPTIGATNPPLLNKKCHGRNLTNIPIANAAEMHINLDYLIEAYQQYPQKQHFFNSYFEKLMGVSYVKTMIINNYAAKDIKAQWAQDIVTFKKQRKPYLLYPE